MGIESPQPTAAAPPPPPKQSRLDAFIRKLMSPQQSNKIASLILNVIVGDLRSINIVEGEHFKALIEYLAPGYSLPSRQTFQKIEKNEKALRKKSKLSLLPSSTWQLLQYLDKLSNAVLHYSHCAPSVCNFR